MIFLLALAAIAASGFGVLGLLRLRTGNAAADGALAWFAGGAWFGVGVMALRFLGHFVYSRWSAGAVLLAPLAGWFLLSARRAATGQRSPAARGRWLARPTWVFGPLAVYVLVVAASVVLHGFNTPTHTDDGLRVRAFVPTLAFEDEWGPRARALLVQAGPVPAFVPSLGWVLSRRVDPFHVNYAVLVTFLAFLTLAVALGAARRAPERGWTTAFGTLSLPLFVYHCTSTYSDAVLAMHCGLGLLFHIEYSQRGEWQDAARALLLYLAAALVKQEGEIVAATCAAVLASQVAWNWRQGRRIPPWAMAIPLLGYAVALASRVAAVGVKGAFPILGDVAWRVGGAGLSQASLREAALHGFVEALLWSGNAGMLFWILPAALLLRAREVRTRRLGWPLAVVLALFLEVAASSIWVFPAYTMDGSTVHRALLTVSLAASVWLAALLVPPRSLPSSGAAGVHAPAPQLASAPGEGSPAA